jgi:hypothetical protein
MSNNIQRNRINIEQEVIAILRTVLALEQKSGLNYLSRVLRGDDRFGFRNAKHRAIATFGSLAGFHESRVRNLVNYMIKEQLLEIVNFRYGHIGLTAKGTAFLEQPGEFAVRPAEIRMSNADFFLLHELKNLRREISRSQGRPPFRVFTDYILQRVIQDKPRTVVQLKRIPGMTDRQADTYGPMILLAVRRAIELEAKRSAERIRMMAQSPSLQRVKSLFNSALEVEAIAESCSIQPKTVRDYLCTLHMAGEINLIPWIETHLDNQSLHKGVEYFTQVRNPKLSDAARILEMDFDSLKFCKLYASSSPVMRATEFA